MSDQLQFPFPSLDFPGRVTLGVAEIAAKLGITSQHVLDLVEEGKLSALDVRGAGASRSCFRIPLESYRDYVATSVTSPESRAALLRSLPKASLRDLQREIARILSA